MQTPPARRRDPLRTYQFRVGFAGRADYVAGVQKVSGLNVTVSPSEVWEGGNSLHRYANPDRATWDPITLEQGLALDDTLEQWAAAVVEFLKRGSRSSSVAVKRNVMIDVWEPLAVRPRTDGLEERGSIRLRRYQVFNAWISRFQALPALDAMANNVALLSVEMIHEGWRVVPENEWPTDLTNRA